MSSSNQTILQKADIALADITLGNGLLQPAQSAAFIKLLILQSKVLGMSTVTPLKAQKEQINKIRFTQRVLRNGSEGVALPEADRAKPAFTNVEHDVKLFKAEVRMTNELLEDNLEGSRFRDTIMTMMSEAMSRDMEEVVVRGDTASSDSFLAQFDGILKSAVSNQVNAGGATTNKGIFRDMLKTMPSEWLRDKGMLRFLTSVDSEIDYRDSLSDRMTVTGDRALGSEGESAPVGYSGIPVIDIPLFPENLGGSSNQTNMLLLDPKNIDVGIWRDIRIETDKDISEGVVKIVATIRFDVKYVEELAVVKATAVKVGA
jgi:hypothetical protein